MDRFMLILGWSEITLCIGIAIGLVIFAFLGEAEHSMLYLRGLIIIPFGLWWGIREVKRAKRG